MSLQHFALYRYISLHDVHILHDSTGKLGFSLLWWVLNWPLDGILSWIALLRMYSRIRLYNRRQWWETVLFWVVIRCPSTYKHMMNVEMVWWKDVTFHGVVKVIWCRLHPQIRPRQCDACSCRCAGGKVMTSCPRWVWLSLLGHFHSRPFPLCHSPFPPGIQMSNNETCSVKINWK